MKQTTVIALPVYGLFPFSSGNNGAEHVSFLKHTAGRYCYKGNAMTRRCYKDLPVRSSPWNYNNLMKQPSILNNKEPHGVPLLRLHMLLRVLLI